MTCRDAIALFADYLESTLSDDVLAALEAHLHDCPPCQAYLRTYRRTQELASAEARVEMPPEMKARLREFLLERIRKSRA
jgi:anti-sigma factor RsiW